MEERSHRGDLYGPVWEVIAATSAQLLVVRIQLFTVTPTAWEGG